MNRNLRIFQQVATTAMLLIGSLVVLAGPAGAAVAECEGQPATIVGTTGPDILYGTPADDVVWLGGSHTQRDMFVDPFGGDDLICQGGPGSMHIQAGPGDDSVLVADGATVYGDAGADRIEGGQRPDLYFFGGPGDDTLTGSTGGGSMFGGPGADTLTGGAGREFMIEGGEGDDHIDAGAGDDRVLGSPGNDTIDGGGGDDELDYSSLASPSGVAMDLAAGTVTSDTGTTQATGVECWTGTPNADTIDGSPGPDCINGADGGGADTIRAFEGDDRVWVYYGSADGGGGADEVRSLRQSEGEPADQAATVELRGGEGDDRMILGGLRVRALGESGSDTFNVAAEDAVVDGGDGDNRMELSSGGELDVRTGTGSFAHLGREYALRFDQIRVFVGSYWRDEMRGSGADEEFFGERGKDLIRGGGGDDRLSGGEDNDDLSGGKGTDVALGGKDKDRCKAETEQSCERA
jgi:Ca2+-binding RTX toxin-like protein